ncbi:MAG: hypothetical protein ACFCU1_14100 [Sumerlaeia bacterium]
MVDDVMLDINRDDFSLEFILDRNIKDNSEFITYYLCRACLKKIRFIHPAYTGLRIELSKNPKPEPYIIDSPRNAIIEVDIDYERLMALSNSNRRSYFIDKIREGIEKFSRFYEFPKKEVFECLDEFIEGGCINRWVYKKRSFREHKLQVLLHADLAEQYFKIKLEVIHKKEQVLYDTIFIYDPNPFGYPYFIKDIVIEDGYLTVTNKFGDPKLNICKIPLDQLIK